MKQPNPVVGAATAAKVLREPQDVAEELDEEAPEPGAQIVMDRPVAAPGRVGGHPVLAHRPEASAHFSETQTPLTVTSQPVGGSAGALLMLTLILLTACIASSLRVPSLLTLLPSLIPIIAVPIAARWVSQRLPRWDSVMIWCATFLATHVFVGLRGYVALVGMDEWAFDPTCLLFAAAASAMLRGWHCLTMLTSPRNSKHNNRSKHNKSHTASDSVLTLLTLLAYTFVLMPAQAAYNSPVKHHKTDFVIAVGNTTSPTLNKVGAFNAFTGVDTDQEQRISVGPDTFADVSLVSASVIQPTWESVTLPPVEVSGIGGLSLQPLKKAVQIPLRLQWGAPVVHLWAYVAPTLPNVDLLMGYNVMTL